MGIVWSCFSDGTLKYEQQASVWLKTLRHAAGRLDDVVIHAYAPSAELVAMAERDSASIVEVHRLHPEHPPSNKLAQLDSPILAAADWVVMCDCDLAFCGDVTPALGADVVRAKLADLANPPLDVWLWLLGEAGYETPPRLAATTHDQAPTYAGNFNGGLYVLPGSAFLALREAWPRWNAWVLERSARLGRWAWHADQISFGLAIEELGLAASPLGPEMNFPTHLEYADRGHLDLADPRVLHYHRLDRSGRLRRTGLPGVDAAVGRVNVLLDELRSTRGVRRRGGSTMTNRPPKIVVASGWWCDERPHDWQISDHATTSPAFFELWNRLVMKYIQPDTVFITDSASPIKPDGAIREAVSWIELDRNYGHSNDIRIGRSQTRYSGVTRSRILGCTYALCCDADIYVYLEQDCVIRGERFLDAALWGTTEGVIFGPPPVGGRGKRPGTVPGPLYQNSVTIVRGYALERYLSGILAGSETDGEFPAELKNARDCAPFDLLPIPYGRSRPIDFTRSHFYAQHLTTAELAAFCASENVEIPSWPEPPALVTSSKTEGDGDGGAARAHPGS